jgi:hypothetical protein
MVMMLNPQGGMKMSRFALSAAESRFLGLDSREWSVTLAGSVLIGLVVWLV